ncbi:MAG: glycosyltransferase family 39 protein [Pseudomonadota bacterium]
MAHLLTKALLLAFLFFMAACPGLKFLRLVGCKARGGLEVFVLSAACGFAIISEGLLIVGMLGFFTPLIMFLLVMLLFAVSAKEAKFFIDVLARSLTSFSFTPSVHYVLAPFFGVFIAINMLKALLPPHGPTDVLYYHLTLPKLYLANGAIVTNPTFFPSLFPSNGELLFSLSLILGGPTLVNLTHFGFALLTVLALYVYAQKYFGKEWALLPGIIYLTAPVINSWGTMAYTDTILGYYLFLLCMLFLEYDNQEGRKTAIVCGLLTGMALGIKYQAIPLVACLYLFFFVYYLRRWQWFFPLLVFSLVIGGFLVSPWLIRNLVVTHNPFFPILRDLFPSEMLRPETTWGEDTQARQALLRAMETLKDNPLSPFSYFFSGAWRNDDFQRFIGPLFLGFAPFIFFLKRTPVKWPLTLLVCLFSYLSALILRGNVRYVIVLVILLSLLCGAAGQEIICRGKRWERIFLTLFVCVVTLLYSLQNYHLMLSHKRILTALNPRLTSSFLRTFEPSYRAAEFANQHIPTGAKVLFQGLVRYFYFNAEPLNDHLGQQRILYDEAKTGEDILQIMRHHGITHIIRQEVISENARSTTVPYDIDPRFVEFTHRYLEKIFTAHGVSIYRIRSS